MSSSNAYQGAEPTDAELAAIGTEPDEVPTTFLMILTGALSIGVVVTVAAVVVFFRFATAHELSAKGYPMDAGATWSGNP